MGGAAVFSFRQLWVIVFFFFSSPSIFHPVILSLSLSSRRHHFIIYFHWWMWFSSITSSLVVISLPQLCSAVRRSSRMDLHHLVGALWYGSESVKQTYLRADAFTYSNNSNYAVVFRYFLGITFSRALERSPPSTVLMFILEEKLFQLKLIKVKKLVFNCARGCGDDGAAA